MNYEFYLPLCNETFRVTEIMVPAGVPIEMRALPPNNTGGYHQYEVQLPLKVQKSQVAPWFGKIGYGVQYKLPNKVEVLMKQGYIRYR